MRLHLSFAQKSSMKTHPKMSKPDGPKVFESGKQRARIGEEQENEYLRDAADRLSVDLWGPSVHDRIRALAEGSGPDVQTRLQDLTSSFQKARVCTRRRVGPQCCPTNMALLSSMPLQKSNWNCQLELWSLWIVHDSTVDCRLSRLLLALQMRIQYLSTSQNACDPRHSQNVLFSVFLFHCLMHRKIYRCPPVFADLFLKGHLQAHLQYAAEHQEYGLHGVRASYTRSAG